MNFIFENSEMAVDYLTDVADILDDFFKGLAECGLLTSYAVQLQTAIGDLELLMRFRTLIYQFIKRLQKLLIRIPSFQNSTTTIDVSTQTSVRDEDSIPSESTVKSTAELVVTCHPVTVTSYTGDHNFMTNSCFNSSEILTVKAEPIQKTQKGGEQSVVNEKHEKDFLYQDGILTQVDISHRENVDERKVVSDKCAKPACYVNNNQDRVTPIQIVELQPMRVSEDSWKNDTANELDEFIQTKNDAVDRISVTNEEIDVNNENVVHIVVETIEKSPHITLQEEHGDSNSKNDTEEKDDTAGLAFDCDECDKSFKSSKSLEKHLQGHSGFCNMCSQVFSCVQSLQEHCRTTHNGAGCFMCETCGKRFMTKLSYTRHVDSHGGKRGAICHVCGKSFSRADYLQTHYTIHMGKRTFACSQCPRTFVRSIQLKAHEKTHSGIKDHICKVCSKGFARSDKLKEHMLRHLNIKRFQCSECSRDYAEKRDLKIHFLKVHMSAQVPV